MAIEQKIMKDAGADGDKSFDEFGMQGRNYTWSGGETLIQLLARKDQIMERHQQVMEREAKVARNRPLWEILGSALDDEDGGEQCSVCAL